MTINNNQQFVCIYSYDCSIRNMLEWFFEHGSIERTRITAYVSNNCVTMS